jgi:hypothetical protein
MLGKAPGVVPLRSGPLPFVGEEIFSPASQRSVRPKLISAHLKK